MAQASKPNIEGVRVIRGPDWKAADLDGGEGHVGTVTSLPGSGMVHVIWDVGDEMDCRAGLEGKFDLRVFDSGTVDVHHEAPCQSCQQDVYGALWRCQNCPACSLCSRCYADDQHEAGHQFLRFDLPTSTGKLMKKRKISVKIRAVGLFPGATVVRGNHWKWGNQDGGPGSEGEIVDYVESPEKKGRRNVVTVTWPSGRKNVYRLGFEGLVDIKCLEEEVGGFYYRDHLPVLDTDDFSSLTLDAPGAKTDPVPSDLTLSSPGQQESASVEEGTAHSLKREIPAVIDDLSSRSQKEETMPSVLEDGKTLEQSQEAGELSADRGEKLGEEKEEKEDRLAPTLQTSDTSEAPHKMCDASSVSVSETSLQTSDVPSSLSDPLPDNAGAAGNEGQGLTTGSPVEEEVASAGIVAADTMEAALETPAAAGRDAEIGNVADSGGGSHREGAFAGGWRIGDRAVIAVPKEELKELQHGFGGVTHTMLRKIGRMGVVTRLGPGPNTVGLRLSRTVFRVNRAALMRVHTFSVGDKVRILDDLFKLNIINERIGWRSSMDDTAGKVGEITKIDEDGDLRVQFADRMYPYSPACCVPAPGATVDAVGNHTGGLGDQLETLLDGDLRERLAGLLGATGGMGGGGGGGGHRMRMSDLTGMRRQLLEQLQSAGGLSGLVDLDDDESEEGELRKAIVDGDLQKVTELCLSNPSLVNSSNNELTPLMIASHKGKRKIVEALLDMGASVNARGVKDNTPLCFALDEKEEEVALLLIERGADVTPKNGKGRTPLHMAAYNRCNEAAQLIIHMGADVNAQDKYGDTPLHDAIARENVGIVELLTQMEQVNVRLTNKRGYSPLAWACRVKNAEILNLILIRDSSNVNAFKDGDHAAIHIAAFGKFFEGVYLLVTVGNADVNLKTGDKGLTVLHAACLVADVEAVESILCLGADVNMQDRSGDTALHLAMGGHDGRSDKSTFDMGKDVQSRLKIARLLISRGAFVDAENRKGRPPTTYGLPEVQNGIRYFIEQNPSLVSRKKAPKPAGAVSTSIMTSLRDFSMLCRLCQRPSDVTLVPCGHRTVCRACAVSVKNCPLCGAFVRREETIKGTLFPPKVDRMKKNQNGVQSKPFINEAVFATEATAVKLVFNSKANGQSKSAEETPETDPPHGNMEDKSAGGSSQQSVNMRQDRNSDQHQAELESTFSQSTSTEIQKNEPHEGRESTAVTLSAVEQSEQKAEEDNTPPKPSSGFPSIAELSSGYTTLQGDKDMDTDGQATHRSHLASGSADATVSQPAVLQVVPEKNCPSAVDQCTTTLKPEAVLSAEILPSSGWTLCKTKEAAESEYASGMQKHDVASSFRGSESRLAGSGSRMKPEKEKCAVRPNIFSLVDEEAVPWSFPRRQNSPAVINDNKAFGKQTANPPLSLSEEVDSQTVTDTKKTSFQFSVNEELELPELPNISLVSMWGQDSSSDSKDVVQKAPDSACKPQYLVPNSGKGKHQTANLGERKDYEEVGTSTSIPSEPGLAEGAMNLKTSWMTSRRHLSQVSRSDDEGLVPINTDLGHSKSPRMTTEEPASLTEELVRHDLGLPPRLPSDGISQESKVSTPWGPKVTGQSLGGRFGSTNVHGSLPSSTEKNSTVELKPNEKGEASALEHGLVRSNLFSANQFKLNGRFGDSESSSLQVLKDKAEEKGQTVDENTESASTVTLSYQHKGSRNDVTEDILSIDNKTWSAGLSLIHDKAPEPKTSDSLLTNVDKMHLGPDLALSLPLKLEHWQYEFQRKADREYTNSTNTTSKKPSFAAQGRAVAPDDVPHGVDVRLSLPLKLHDLKWDFPRREKEDEEQTVKSTGNPSNVTKSRTLNDPAISSMPLMSPMQSDLKWDFSKEVDENKRAEKEIEDSFYMASCTNNRSSVSTKSGDYVTTSLTTPNSYFTKEVTADFVKTKDNAFDESSEKVSDAEAHTQISLGHQRAFPNESDSVNTKTESKTTNQASIVINTEQKENQFNYVCNKLAEETEQNQSSIQVATVTNEIKECSALGTLTSTEKQNQGTVNVIGGQNKTTECSTLSTMTTVNENPSSDNITASTTGTKENTKKDKIDIPKNVIHVDNLAAIFSSMGLKANVDQQGTLEVVPDKLAKRPMMPTMALGRQNDNFAMTEAIVVTGGTTDDVSLSRDLTVDRLYKERETIAASANKYGFLEPAAELMESAFDPNIQAGHRVVIKVNADSLRKLQTNFGGATENMLQCLGNTGVVTAVDKDGSVRVQFRTLSYRFNPQVLLRVPDLQVGDIVRIHDDLDLVQRLNRHVGFGSGMVKTLGKTGKVINIDSDGDVKISFGNRSFLYSPACCVPSPGATIDILTTSAGGESGPSVLNSSSSSNNSDGPTGIDLEGLEKMKMLAQMVKEEGSSMSRILNSVENPSSAISRLFDAIEEGDSGVVRALCQSDPALINREHKRRKLTPLMFAGWKGLEDMVSLLLDLGADVNQSLTDSSDAHTSCCPLLASLESRREDAAILLLQRGADPNCRSLRVRGTPMHYAAERNLLQVLQVLLLEGADVNAQDKDGDTPLTMAVLTGHAQAAEVILGDPRVDFTLASRKGVSPLHAACLRSFPSIVQEILLRDTSQVNVQMDGEYTPLHLAANDDCVENIKLLVLVGGADVNCVAGGREHAGTRPLHMACLRGNYSCVEALLDFGAAVNVKDKDGDTPLHFAIGGKVPSDGGEEVRMMFIEGRVRIACLLISNGAFVDAENHAGRTCMRYGVSEVQTAVQDFMDQNRHLVVKQGRFGGDAQRSYRTEPGPCAVCKTRTSAVTLLPCGHKVTCSECCVNLAQCPQCQKAVLDSTSDDAKGALFEPI